MAIYQITNDGFVPMETTTFSEAGFKEREHLQQHLKNQIGIIAPDILIISEEFGDWQDSRRRIDLLGIDRKANIVVVELKRTEDGGHMELQAIRYAAMVSTMTFDRAVEVYGDYLNSEGTDEDARERILDFLEWDEPDDDQFAQEVRVVLASAEFSRELTTSVLWLNERGLDIRCIRLRPYKQENNLYVDIQQVIPLPEAEEYQVRIRDKTRLERVSRSQNRDLTKYDVTIDGQTFRHLPKRRAIYQVVRHLCDSGINPEEISAMITWRGDTMRRFDGKMSGSEFERVLVEKMLAEGKKNPRPKRYFIADSELIYANGSTYSLTKMWGTRTAEAMSILLEKYPQFGICFEKSQE